MFIRIDENNPRFLQVLLSGLDDTPYSNGLFLFDIYLCHNYPNIPPKIKHITKGSNLITANFTPGGYSPNLHSSTGTVCLSLLGTWSGPGWEAGKSNVYQLLSTILYWILGSKHPYYMEPGNGGWEGTIDMNKKEHSINVINYDKKVLLHVLEYAILNTIINPYKEFENVIKMYYKLKSKTLIEWINKCINNSIYNDIKNKIIQLKNKIQIELNKLKNFKINNNIEIDDDIDDDIDIDMLQESDNEEEEEEEDCKEKEEKKEIKEEIKN